MMGLTEDERAILATILQGPFEVLVFGSRVMGTHKPFSDIDICLKGKTALPHALLSELKSALDESSLPYKVDLLDYHRISDSFRKVVDGSALKWEP